jgi:hypothetical protein
VAKSKALPKKAGTKSAKAKPAKPKLAKPKPAKAPKKPPRARKLVPVEPSTALDLVPVDPSDTLPQIDSNVPIARPRITSPNANSEVDDAQDLTVTGTVNIGTLRYRLELWEGDELLGSWDATPDSSLTVQFTIPEGDLEDGKFYRLVLKVHPDDAGTGTHLDHTITVTTEAATTTTPPVIE